MELTEFLLARIAEDEATPPNPGTWVGYVEGISDATWREIDAEEAAWAKRWAAECDAKRRIVKMRKTYDGRPVAGEPQGAVSAIAVGAAVLDATLRALALPYADHPDYQEEWRP